MRLTVLLGTTVAFALGVGPVAAQVTNYQTPGNLEATSPLGCVSLSKVTDQLTPADIYPGMAACIKLGENQKAALLFAVAGAFGYFDGLRVADPSARQAASVVEMNAVSDLTTEQKLAFKKVLFATLDSNSAGFKSVCSAVGRLGPPKYFPTYMVQHGMSAFLGGSRHGLNPNFDPTQGWRTSVTSFLHCP